MLYGQAIFTIVTVTSVAIAVALNVILIISFIFKRKARHYNFVSLSICVFVVFLALDDTLLAIINGGLVLFSDISTDGPWVFGETACKLRDPLLFCFVGVSSSLMALVAWERYNLLELHDAQSSFLAKSQAAKSNILKVIAIVASVVGLNVLFSIPGFQQSKQITLPVGNLTEIQKRWSCVEEWNSPRALVYYKTFHFAITFVIPLTTALILHVQLMRIMKSTTNGEQPAARKTSKVLVAVIIVFAVCWTPHQIAILALEVYSSGLFSTIALPVSFPASELFVGLKLLTIVQSCLSPFFYGYLIYNRRVGRASPLTHDSILDLYAERHSALPAKQRKPLNKAMSAEIRLDLTSIASNASNGNNNNRQHLRSKLRRGTVATSQPLTWTELVGHALNA